MFEPNRLPPRNTYVNRLDKSYSELGIKKTYEDRLESSLKRIGFITVIVSNSKNGKRSLIKKVIPDSKLIEISARELEDADIYTAISKKISFVNTKKSTDKLNVSLFSKITESNYNIDIKQEVIKEIQCHGSVILFDDFHYLNLSLQKELAFELKGLIENVKVVVATHPHLKNNLTMYNPDLNGRIDLIEIVKWTDEEIKEIFEKGFESVKYQISEKDIDYCVSKALNSPLIAQELGFNLVDNFEANAIDEKSIDTCLLLSCGTFNHESIIGRINEEKKGAVTIYNLKTGEQCQIIKLLLLCMVKDPMKIEHSVQDFLERAESLLVDTSQINNEKIIRGMNKLVIQVADERILGLFDNNLYIFDVTFLLYLKIMVKNNLLAL